MVQNDLAAFWTEKEKEWGRTISIYEVMQATGISWVTVKRMRQGKAWQANGRVIDALCRFFGVPAGPVPFLVYAGNGKPADPQA